MLGYDQDGSDWRLKPGRKGRPPRWASQISDWDEKIARPAAVVVFRSPCVRILVAFAGSVESRVRLPTERARSCVAAPNPSGRSESVAVFIFHGESALRRDACCSALMTQGSSQQDTGCEMY